jgi:hypothetical protein
MNVRELKHLIEGLDDNAPVLLIESGPRSKKPDAFEDEYGPGEVTFNVVHVNGPFASGTLTLCKAEQALGAVLL